MRPKKTAKRETRITIAIEGEGVTPSDVGLRQLAQLLEATAATFDAVAAEKRLEPPKISLAKVKHGSAAYELVSDDRQANRVVQGLVTTVRRRGKGASPRTRSSLLRLHNIAAKTGALRLDPAPQGEGGKAKPIYLAAPVEDEEIPIEEGTVVFARVVGVRLDSHDHANVALRYDDGGQGEFEAATELLEQAARFIGKHVAARVTYMRGEERDFEGAIEALDERPMPGGFMTAISEARELLAQRGVVVDAKAWLAEEHDE